MARDEFFGIKDDITAPFTTAEAVTPSDSVELSHVARAFYVGLGGNVAVVMESGVSVTFVNIQSGSMLPARIKKVMATGTTATNIVAVW